MPEPHTSAGDESLRQHILDAWTHVALIDDDGTEETRIDIDDDNRVSWLTDATDNPLELEIDIAGSDSDIDVPVALERSELYDTGDGGEPLSGDDFDGGVASIGVNDDEVTVTHEVFQPDD